jgi:hypothetical protein
MIAVEEQNGKERADYGKVLLGRFFGYEHTANEELLSHLTKTADTVC